MNMSQTLDLARDRMNSAVHKLGWGMRVVGVAATGRGMMRVLKLRVQRPRHAEISLKSGYVLEFGYPSQFPVVLVMFGDLIDPEFAFLRKVSIKNWIFADIGAAIGQFTLFAAGLPGAIVHAFEPSGANVATLKKNIARNGVGKRVSVHKLALSNADGESRFETTALTWTSRLKEAGAPGTETVTVRTLAGELERLGIDHLSVLKINVAGFEPEVMEGAMPFLADGGADIIILLLGLRSLPWYARIAACGYRFFYYHPMEHALYEVTAFDEASVLHHRPWPARHIIAIHQKAIDAGVVAGLTLRKA
jgi:FkbM family methyltransferase